MRKLTQAEFLSKAVAVHGAGRYDYSQTVYAGADNKIIIICPTHGEFEQVARFHANRGCGCPKCQHHSMSVARSFSIEDFVKKSEAIHGKKYNYSIVSYVNNSTNVKIICPKHGVFEQRPAGHLKGQGCRACSNIRKPQIQPFTTKLFLEKARANHNDTYDYSRCNYENNRSVLDIICPVHGSFKQVAANHLSGQGCSKCAGVGVSNTLEFVIKAHLVHGNKYSYDETIYSGAHNICEISCPIHGLFKQKANNHLMGKGCKQCARDKLSELGKANAKIIWYEQAKGRPGILYFIRVFSVQEEFFKIGITFNSVQRRYVGKGSLTGYAYEILAQHTSQDAARIYDWEQSILETFAHLRYRPKHSFPGATECFSEADPILAIFPL